MSDAIKKVPPPPAPPAARVVHEDARPGEKEPRDAAQEPTEGENKIWVALAWMYRRLQNGYGRLPFVEEAMALAKDAAQAAQPCRDDVLEEAAKVCDAKAHGRWQHGALTCAAAIRALRTQPAQQATAEPVQAVTLKEIERAVRGESK